MLRVWGQVVRAGGQRLLAWHGGDVMVPWSRWWYDRNDDIDMKFVLDKAAKHLFVCFHDISIPTIPTFLLFICRVLFWIKEKKVYFIMSRSFAKLSLSETSPEINNLFVFSTHQAAKWELFPKSGHCKILVKKTFAIWRAVSPMPKNIAQVYLDLFMSWYQYWLLQLFMCQYR